MNTRMDFTADELATLRSRWPQGDAEVLTVDGRAAGAVFGVEHLGLSIAFQGDTQDYHLSRILDGAVVAHGRTLGDLFKAVGL
jgi:hypothetical protein